MAKIIAFQMPGTNRNFSYFFCNFDMLSADGHGTLDFSGSLRNACSLIVIHVIFPDVVASVM